MLNEIIFSKRIPKEAIINGDVNHLIRIADKNKWSKNSVFELKESHLDENSIKIIIVSSNEYIAKCIPNYVLKGCYYKNREEFEKQWERLCQKWEGKAWVIKFRLLNGNGHVKKTDYSALLSNEKMSPCVGCYKKDCTPEICKDLTEWVG